jgi:hypothetical protein
MYSKIKTKAAIIALLFLLATGATAQFPYDQSFRNGSITGLVFNGNAKLTAATGIDPVGNGFLRLTDALVNQVGYVYAVDSFPSVYGITAQFEFNCYNSSGFPGDGISFFLFDSRVNAFRPGGLGGALGYAQQYNTPGLAKGYIGIGIDEFGNFSSATDGNKNGGPGNIKGAVVIRGPGNGKTATDYVYQTGVNTGIAPYKAGFLGFHQRYTDPSDTNYRAIKIILTPGSTLGANLGFTVTVILTKGGTPSIPITLINNWDFPFVAPPSLQFGMSASTGSAVALHEIRNMLITPTNTSGLLAPKLANDSITVCPGQTGILDITANDLFNNPNGYINKNTIDLDTVTAGRQTTYTDAGKGTYTVGANGIVSFVPVNGFTGKSIIGYTETDNFGISATKAGLISVDVSGSTAPSLTITSPPGVCAPSFVDITSSGLKSNTTPGATYNYFGSLTDANTNTNNINPSASSLTTTGTYYIRAQATGCATIVPVSVVVSQSPTIAAAGNDQTFCSSTGNSSTSFTANNPDVGSGSWSQISGPTTAVISLPNSANTPANGLQKGIYTFRWSIASGACATSTSDLKVTVGVVSNAGPAQSFANGAATTLAANDPTPATGTWTLVSGPNTASITSPNNYQTTVTSLAPGNNYVFRWTIVNGSCSSNTTVLVADTLNTISDAGSTQSLSNVSTVTLAGNTPDANNTGVWTVVSSPAGSTPIITSPSDPHTTITSLNIVGDYYFRWTITNGSYSNFTTVKITLLSILPVNMLAFAGKIVTDKILLNWSTDAEINNDHFVVERSSNGSSFDPVGTVSGFGTSNTTNNYTFTDNSKSISTANVYYRLQQVDKNGKSAYSSIIKVTLLNTLLTSDVAWPNPFKDKINIRVYSASKGIATINLFNNAGKLIKQTKQLMSAGYNDVIVDNIPVAATALYFIEVIKGNTSFRQKLLRER